MLHDPSGVLCTERSFGVVIFNVTITQVAICLYSMTLLSNKTVGESEPPSPQFFTVELLLRHKFWPTTLIFHVVAYRVWQDFRVRAIYLKYQLSAVLLSCIS